MLFDIGAGILLAILTTNLFHLPLTATFLIGGIIFTLLMDIDYIFYLSKGGSSKNAHEHRDLLHYPLLYIPTGMLVISFFDFNWAVLFGLCSLTHFLHDSIGIGWGIKWFWPFSRRSYKFFSEKNGRFSLRLLVSWDHEELIKVADSYGDPNWFRNIYLRPHPINIIELLFFLLALAALYLCAGRC